MIGCLVDHPLWRAAVLLAPIVLFPVLCAAVALQVMTRRHIKDMEERIKKTWRDP